LIISNQEQNITTVLPVLLHSLANARPETCEWALSNFLLLVNDPVNATQFLSRPGWQNWLFPLFLEGHVGEAVIRDVRSNVFKMSMTIVTTLHYQFLTQERKDLEKSMRQAPKFNMIHGSIEFLAQFAGWTQQTASLGRMMLLSILNKVKLRARDLTNNFNYTASHSWDNVFALLAVVNDFLFYRPVKEGKQAFQVRVHEAVTSHTGPELGTEAGLHIDSSSGVPVDQQLVDRTVEVLMALNLNRPDPAPLDAEEGRIKKQGEREYKFFSTVQTEFKALAATQKEHERAKLLRVMGEKLEERNKGNPLLAGQKRSTDLTQIQGGFLGPMAKENWRFV